MPTTAPSDIPHNVETIGDKLAKAATRLLPMSAQLSDLANTKKAALRNRWIVLAYPVPRVQELSEVLLPWMGYLRQRGGRHHWGMS